MQFMWHTEGSMLHFCPLSYTDRLLIGTELQPAHERRLGKDCTSPGSLWPLCCPKHYCQVPQPEETSWQAHRCLQQCIARRCIAGPGAARCIQVDSLLNKRLSSKAGLMLPNRTDFTLRDLTSFLQAFVDPARSCCKQYLGRSATCLHPLLAKCMTILALYHPDSVACTL